MRFRAGAVVLCVPLVAILAAVPAPGQTPPGPPPQALVPPHVERGDPELAQLRDRLLNAIGDRRADVVRAAMASELIDQDTPASADDVIAAFGPLEPGAPLPDEWRALEQALRLGGAMDEGRYVVPYIAPHVAGWQGRREQRFVAGRDVAVRRAPDTSAPVIARLSHALVAEEPRRGEQRGAPGSACASWTLILLEDGAGWICTIHTRHVSGLYYAFERIDGAWRLTRIYSVLR